ncbi:MAG: hypothetical protein AAB500_02350 [Patescibacteria group bacterium]
MKIVSVGGRIKSASVGLDVFVPGNDNFQTQMKQARDNPPMPILSAFFPSDKNRMKQMMQGIGFYRPMLKTDQGMGGNFLPFYVDPVLRTTDLSPRQIVREEGLIIPELYLEHDPGTLQELRETFQRLDLWNADRILTPLLTQSREAEKGRTPFFFIRPALLSSPIVFGDDIVKKVNEVVGQLLKTVEDHATGKAGFNQTGNYLYFLADVFVTTEGEVVVEKLHFPDVGFFMSELELKDSIAFETQGVVRQILDQVFGRVLGMVNSRVVYIITRDEVLQRNEDVLEIFEIRSISRKFCEAGIQVEVRSVSQAGEIPSGATCLLLNIAEHGSVLLERYGRGELVCYPSPYLQLASRELTGLRESVVPRQFMSKFISLIDCSPKEHEDAETVVSKINVILSKDGVVSELLHVEVDGETVPVHRRIHHSWKQLVKRVHRHRGDKPLEDVALKIRELPLTHRNSMVTSTTGPRLHVFRFTFTA